MSFKTEGRIGNQKPRLNITPESVRSDGDDAAELSSAYGLTLDPWQKLVIRAWLGRDEDDKYTSSTCLLDLPRQNGKNGVLEARELYGMAIIGECILHTAHEVKTARKAFLRLCSFFENDRDYPELASMVVAIRKTNGQEAILLNNGGKIEFSARSKSAGRGFTADVLVLDECQELTDEQLAALLPTLAAAPLNNRQTIYLGTPPDPDTLDGDVFGRVRKNILNGKLTKACLHEWSVGELGCVSDKKRWYDTNPALGIRLTLEAVEAEYGQMDAEKFARERLGWWKETEQKALINPKQWEALAVDNPPDGRLAYGVKFSPDGALVSLSVAVKPKQGPIHVELIERRYTSDGLQWLVDWLIQRKSSCCCVVIDGRSHAAIVQQDLIDGGMPKKAIIVTNTDKAIKAATRFYDAYQGKTLSHFNQTVLNESAIHCKKRLIGRDGGWGYGAVNGFDITPLEACSLALWGVSTSKRNPGKRVRVL